MRYESSSDLHIYLNLATKETFSCQRHTAESISGSSSSLSDLRGRRVGEWLGLIHEHLHSRRYSGNKVTSHPSSAQLQEPAAANDHTVSLTLSKEEV